MYRFEFLGEPYPKGRPRFSRGRVYTPRETTAAEGDIISQLTRQMDERELSILSGPLKVTMLIYKSKPKSARKKDLYPTKRPDLDNYVKLILDAMDKIVFMDDAQIVSMESHKRFDKQPRIIVTVEEI